MTISMIAAIAVFFGSILLSQKLAVNAASKLDDQTKLKIAEIFSKRNVIYNIIVFSIVLVFLVASYLLPDQIVGIIAVYAVALVIYFFGKLILNVRKLRAIPAPESYIRAIIASFGIFFGGVVTAAIVYSFGSFIGS